ncbi:MAG: DNA-binding domain-containing protein [Desulfovibrionaceae bacterium]
MTAIKEAYTAAELAILFGQTERALRTRAHREAWQARPRAGRGGGSEWLVAAMPDETRAAIHVALARAAEDATPAIRAQASDAVVPDWSYSKAKARYRLVSEWRAHVARQAKGGTTAREATQAFLVAYGSGLLLPQVREALGDVSQPTLYRWDKALRDNRQNMEALADRRGGWSNGRKKGLGQISEEAQQAFLKAYLQPNQPSLRLACQGMALLLERQGVAVPTYASVRRFFQRFDAYNHDLVVLHREGHKALEDKVGPYLTRDDKILQVGDVLVSDGHRMNFMVINPETGKPCRMTLVGWQDWASRMFVAFEIMPEENTQAIAASLFRSIQNLGRKPRAVYLDNGRAFNNQYFSAEADMAEHDGLYLRLGIHVQHSAPYVARTKIVERWWGDFDRQASRLVDSYVGADIDHKPAHLHRNERWHQARHNDYVPTLEEAKRMVAAFAYWKGQQPHPTRPGTTPLAMYEAGRGPGMDEAEMAALSRHFLYRRQVTPQRCRIRMLGCEFEAGFLYGINKTLTVYYSHTDLSQVWIYDEGHLMGVARPVATMHPLAAELGTEFDLQQLQAAHKEHAALKRSTLRLAEKVVPSAAAVLHELPHMRPLAERRTTFQAPTKKAAASPLPEPTITETEREALEAARRKALEAAEARPAYTVPAFFASPLEKYAALFEIEVIQGIPLTEEHAAWMRKYEQTDEYLEVAARRYEPLRRLYRKTA